MIVPQVNENPPAYWLRLCRDRADTTTNSSSPGPTSVPDRWYTGTNTSGIAR